MAARWPRTDNSSEPSDPPSGWDTSGPRQTPGPNGGDQGMDLRRKTIVALAGAAMIVGACTSGTPTGSAAAGLDGALVKRADIKIEYVTHGQAQDGFWGVVRNGVKAGAADMGVTANYNAPSAESDMPGWPRSSTPPSPRTRPDWSSRSRTPTPLGLPSRRPSRRASRSCR